MIQNGDHGGLWFTELGFSTCPAQPACIPEGQQAAPGRPVGRHPGWRDLRRMIVAAFVENIGYRQLNSLIRVRAWWTLGRASGWGEMIRVGLDPAEIAKV